MTTETTIDVASSSSQRLGIVARGFEILQRNAWQNSGRARMTGDALMGVAGLATGNPMLVVAGFGGIAINSVLARYGGEEGKGDPDAPFLKRVMSPKEHPVDTNAFWNAGRSILLAVGGAYAAFSKGDVGQGVGAATAGLIGLSSNALVLGRRALARLSDNIKTDHDRKARPDHSAADLHATSVSQDEALDGADQQIAVAHSQHQVKGVIGQGWNYVKQTAKIMLKRAPALLAMAAYPGIAAWALSGVAAVAAGSPVVGGIIIGSATMHGLGMGFKMITPAIQTQLKEIKQAMGDLNGRVPLTSFTLRKQMADAMPSQHRSFVEATITNPLMSLPQA